VTQHALAPAPANVAGGGVIVRSEVLDLWLPDTLTTLAQRRSQSGIIRSHEELQQFLELEDRKDVWYALTVRGHQVDGGFSDVTVIRWPYDDRCHFPRLQAILATVAGNPARYGAADFSSTSIDVLTEEQLMDSPSRVMAELLRIHQEQ
jgi:hypothetical protein